MLRQSDDYGVTWENPSVSTTSGLITIEFANESSGFVGGSNGTILRFDMEGDSWCNLNNPHDNDIYDMTALNENLIWAVVGENYHPSYLQSTDGGGSWFKHDIQTISSLNFQSIYFSDVNNGFLVNAADFLASTIDGGASWQLETLCAPHIGNNNSRAFFLDAYTMWIPTYYGPGVIQLLRNATGISEEEIALVPAIQDLALVISPNPGLGSDQFVSFCTNTESEFTLEVHDLSGRLVHRRSLGELNAGIHTALVLQGAIWNTLPSGFYFCSIRSVGSVGHGCFIVIQLFTSCNELLIVYSQHNAYIYNNHLSLYARSGKT